MHPAVWFDRQLQASGDAFLWAARQAPPPRREAPPPRRGDEAPLGQWSVARHAFHLLQYERAVALPRMRAWLGEPAAVVGPDDEAAAWAAGPAFRDTLARFAAARAEQVALLPRFDDAAWQRPRELDGWGSVTLYWVVSATYQHTAEHTSAVLRIALRWDVVAERLRRRTTAGTAPT
jgi:hypothetical protein